MTHRSFGARLRPNLLALLASAVAPVWAAPTAPAPVRAEVDALLNSLQSSGCQFSRNESWYSGAEARTHLNRKFKYLEGKNLVKSAEDFIERGASTSSSSGKPYLVRCGSTPPLESKTWLKQRLMELRQSR